MTKNIFLGLNWSLLLLIGSVAFWSCKPAECTPPPNDMLGLYDFPIDTEWILRGVDDTTMVDTLRVVDRREETVPMDRKRREACNMLVYTDILHATSPNVAWGEEAYWTLTGSESTQAENYAIEQTEIYNLLTPELLYFYYPETENFVSWDGTPAEMISYETPAGTFEGVRAIHMADLSDIYTTIDTTHPAIEIINTLYFHPQLGFLGMDLGKSGELKIIGGTLL